MAQFNKDSFVGTILVVVGVSLICSVIVAGAAVGLKSIQQDKKMLDKQRNILSVAGLLDVDTDIKEVYARRIEPRVVDLATGEYVEAPDDFDSRMAVKDPAQSISINPEDDFANIKTRAKFSEVYLVKDEQGEISKIVLPMHGNGLWSMMYGFVAIEPDANTVSGITYYEQGETAGLGGEIANPAWQKGFVGKKLYDENGHVAIKIGKGASADKTHGVDGLSGASLTTKGVQGSFKYWFSENGFGPYLQKIQAGAK